MAIYMAADGNLHTTVTASSVARVLNKAGFNRRTVTLGYEIDDTMGWLRVSHFDTESNNNLFLAALARLNFAFRVEYEFTDYDGVQMVEVCINSRKVTA